MTLKVDSISQMNGQQFTFSGWFNVEEFDSGINQILNIALVPNPEDFFFEKTLSNIFILTYHQAAEAGRIVLYLADSPQTWS